MYIDHYVLSVVSLGKQESNYAGIFSKQQTTWQFLKIKLCGALHTEECIR